MISHPLSAKHLEVWPQLQQGWLAVLKYGDSRFGQDCLKKANTAGWLPQSSYDHDPDNSVELR
jgi:hypothetical protein